MRLLWLREEAIPQLLKQLAEQSNMTIADFAKLCNRHSPDDISSNSMYQYISGHLEPPLTKFLAICKASGYDPFSHLLSTDLNFYGKLIDPLCPRVTFCMVSKPMDQKFILSIGDMIQVNNHCCGVESNNRHERIVYFRSGFEVINKKLYE